MALFPNLPPFHPPQYLLRRTGAKASAFAKGYGATGWRDKLRHAQISILEILRCIPVVEIIAFLDLEQNISFLDGHK